MNFKPIIALLSIALLSIALLYSCKKEYVVDVEPIYEGEWHSEPITNTNGVAMECYIIINGDQGIYGEWCDLAPLGSNCSSYFSGEAKINKKQTRIVIGKVSDGKVGFRVDVPPHLNSDGNWECTLTSRVYIRD